MTLKEIGVGGGVTEYPDGGFIPRSRLAKIFNCDPLSIERAFRRGKIEVEERQGRTDVQRYLPVDQFPRFIAALVLTQRENKGKPKISSMQGKIRENFSITSVSGVKMEYTYPKR